MSLRVKLIISMFVIIITCTAIFIYISQSSMKTYSHQQASRLITDNALGLSRSIQSWVVTNSRIVEAMANKQQTSSDVSPDAIVYGYKAGGFFATYVGNEQKQFTIHPDREMKADYDPRKRPWYVKTQKLNRTIITAPYTSSSTGKRMITFATPVVRNGSFSGVVGADVLMDTVTQALKDNSLAKNGFSFLMNEKGIIQAHVRDDLLGKKVNDLSKDFTPEKLRALTKGSEMLEVKIGDTAYLTLSKPVANTEWYVVSSVEKSYVFSALDNLLKSSLLSSIVIALLLGGVGFFLISRLLRPMQILTKTFDKIANQHADLTFRIGVSGAGEISQMSSSFNQFLGKVQKILKEVVGNADGLMSEAEKTRTKAEENNGLLQTQQAQITDIAVLINDFSDTSSQISSSITTATSAIDFSRTSTQSSMAIAEKNSISMLSLVERIEDASSAITRLDEQSGEINSILLSIQKIAEQTNLLALNAAIEAARAGDQGRGFAVVADEVRTLSQRTNEATQEIKTVIEGLQTQSEKAVQIMQNASQMTNDTEQNVQKNADRLNEILHSINAVAATSDEINMAAKEQDEKINRISELINQIKNASEHLSSSGDKSLELAEHLDKTGRVIHGSLNKFTL